MNKNSFNTQKRSRPLSKRIEQKRQYARSVWPIRELMEDEEPVSMMLADSEIGDALATLAFKLHDAIEARREAYTQMQRHKEDILAEYKSQHEHNFAGAPVIFNEVELKKYNTFLVRHRETCLSNKFSIHMTGTGIGMGYEVECGICHIKEDITDTESW